MNLTASHFLQTPPFLSEVLRFRCAHRRDEAVVQAPLVARLVEVVGVEEGLEHGAHQVQSRLQLQLRVILRGDAHKAGM